MSQPAQQQDPPGTEQQMRPAPDHGEASYRGSGRLAGKAAVVTGADSGIGKAVAIAFAREGADVVISYLDEHKDAEDTRKWVEDAGRAAVMAPMFRLCRAAVPHMPAGGSIIGTTSVNSDMPTPQLLAYDVTKAGVANFMAGLPRCWPSRSKASASRSPRPGRPARRSRPRLRLPGLRRSQLRLRRPDRRHRRQPDPVDGAGPG